MEETEDKVDNEHSVGSKVADFKLIEELGKGSSGVVYTVKSQRDDCIYVMKKIELNSLKDKEQKDCWREVSILKKVNHPNIIKYYTSFLEKGCLYIIMEYAENGDLYSLIKHYKRHMKLFEETDLWRIADEILSGLDYLHKHEIIHRDIKCLNIFITKSKHIKIGDLGVSKIVSNINALHCTRVGTPLYLSPELIKQIPYDFKVDMWSFGISMYHLTCLEPPFVGDNLIVLGNNIVKEKPKPIQSHYSSDLANFIAVMLNKKPEKRPTAKEAFGLFPEEMRKVIQKLKGSSAEGIKPRPFSSVGNRVVSYNKSELLVGNEDVEVVKVKEERIKEIVNKECIQVKDKEKDKGIGELKEEPLKCEREKTNERINKERVMHEILPKTVTNKGIGEIPCITKEREDMKPLDTHSSETPKAKQVFIINTSQRPQDNPPLVKTQIEKAENQSQPRINIIREHKTANPSSNQSNNIFRNHNSSTQSINSNNQNNNSFTANPSKNNISSTKQAKENNNPSIIREEKPLTNQKSSIISINYHPNLNSYSQFNSNSNRKISKAVINPSNFKFPSLPKQTNKSFVTKANVQSSSPSSRGLQSNQQKKTDDSQQRKRPYTASTNRMRLLKSKLASSRPLTAVKSSRLFNGIINQDEGGNNNIINININLYHIDMNKRFLAPELDPLRISNYHSDISLLKSLPKSSRSVSTEINLKKLSHQKKDFIFDKIIKNLELGRICKQLTIRDLK